VACYQNDNLIPIPHKLLWTGTSLGQHYTAPKTWNSSTLPTLWP